MLLSRDFHILQEKTNKKRTKNTSNSNCGVWFEVFFFSVNPYAIRIFDTSARVRNCWVNSKNPECESVQDFYFLPIHSSLFTKIRIRDFLEVIGKK